MSGLLIASNNAGEASHGARFSVHRDEGVWRLDTVSKSGAVLRHARRIRIVLRSSGQALTPCGFNNLETDAVSFEQFLFLARRLHLSAIGE